MNISQPHHTPSNRKPQSDPWSNDPEIQRLDRAEIQAQLNRRQMPSEAYGPGALPLRAGGHVANMPQPEYTGPVGIYYRKAEKRRRIQRRVWAILTPWLSATALAAMILWAAQGLD